MRGADSTDSRADERGNRGTSPVTLLSDFIAADQPGLLLRLFPDGIWVDPSVIVELEDRFGPAIRARVAAGGLTLLIERDYAVNH